jgi:hypothetical protein
VPAWVEWVFDWALAVVFIGGIGVGILYLPADERAPFVIVFQAVLLLMATTATFLFLVACLAALFGGKL